MAVLPRTIGGSFAYASTDINPACRFLSCTAATVIHRSLVSLLFPRLLIMNWYGVRSAFGGFKEADVFNERIARHRAPAVACSKRMIWEICEISETKKKKKKKKVVSAGKNKLWKLK